MGEVLKALQELTVCWKKIGHYNMKCRWLPPIPMDKQEHFTPPSLGLSMQGGSFPNDGMDHSTPDGRDAVKFEIQVFFLQSLLIMEHIIAYYLDLFISITVQSRPCMLLF
jgi:hypothetical protein